MDNENMKTNDGVFNDMTRRVSGSGPSFRTALGRARKQAEIDAWCSSVRPNVDELCKIVALIYVLDDDNRVYIGGEMYPAAVVKEIFEELTAAHFDAVLTKFAAVRTPIMNKRAYLTTALFNSVFELEADITNKIKSEW